mmetsp:Transcript_32708/g.103539  ORF Transcript_32708/g.103539 Transcript_32708/m.103539 type:complete len:377 (-) Transcript_32708:2214-3344(-)
MVPHLSVLDRIAEDDADEEHGLEALGVGGAEASALARVLGEVDPGPERPAQVPHPLVQPSIDDAVDAVGLGAMEEEDLVALRVSLQLGVHPGPVGQYCRPLASDAALDHALNDPLPLQGKRLPVVSILNLEDADNVAAPGACGAHELLYPPLPLPRHVHSAPPDCPSGRHLPVEGRVEDDCILPDVLLLLLELLLLLLPGAELPLQAQLAPLKLQLVQADRFLLVSQPVLLLLKASLHGLLLTVQLSSLVLELLLPLQHLLSFGFIPPLLCCTLRLLICQLLLPSLQLRQLPLVQALHLPSLFLDLLSLDDHRAGEVRMREGLRGGGASCTVLMKQARDQLGSVTVLQPPDRIQQHLLLSQSRLDVSEQLQHHNPV